MSPLTARTRVFTILGDPVEHSLSPVIQNAAFQEAGVDGVYVALRCDAEQMVGFMSGLGRGGGAGNVTLPHKEKAASIIDKPSDVGGWLTVVSGTPLKDTDYDGMPDAWELASGLNPNNSEDGSQDRDGDGYTNLEEYLNGAEPEKDSVPPTAPQGVKID